MPRSAVLAFGRLTALVMLLAAFALLPLTAGAAENPKVKESMQTLKALTAELGKPKLDGENLFFGAAKVNGDFTVVDAVKAKHGGTATLFAKKGDGYVRVSTNVMRDDKRAIGSPLDASGPAYAAIKQGNSFYGMVDILGKIYDTGYEPIKSETGDVIGIYYVGYPME
ncbi:MAG: Cache 3/Cache 2 fusion domain-containing protein [Alphaproteobacteria bacterium]|nr:MAG: Cache 3/Cache 2 fusion domain-containing protein [Alphaproteobacteria bacterium]